jgi:hypothetical protein
MRHSRWIRIVLCLTGALMGASALLNYAVNPLGVFAHVDIPGMHGVRNRTANGMMTKFHYARRAEPEVMIFGSSRAGILKPSMLAPYVKGRAYNHYLAGASMNHQRAYIEFFGEHYPVHTMVLGLDFFAFNPVRYLPGAYRAFEPDRLSTGVFLPDYLDALVSIDTAWRSVKTWNDNIKGKPMGEDFSDGHDAEVEHLREFERGGARYVEPRIEGSLQLYAANRELFGNPAFADPASLETALAHLDAIVKFCRAKDIELHVYLSPVSARHLDLIYARGMGAAFERWKVRVAEIAGRAHDFTPKSAISRDVLWWFDAHHIQPKAAPLMIGRIFGDPEMEIPGDFGVILTPATVGGINRAVRESIEPMNLSRFRL